MNATYKRRYEWFEEPDPTEEPAPDAPKNFLSEPGEEPTTEPAPERFRARILVNPTNADVRHEDRSWKAWRDGKLTDEEYLRAISDRVVDWNFAVEDDNGNVTRIQPPASYPDTEEVANAWYALETETFYWLIGMVRYAHLPKLRARLLERPGNTDGTTPTAKTAEVTPTRLTA